MLFNQKKTKEKHNKDYSYTELIPELFLAKQIPDEVYCQIKDNKMVNDLHIYL
jgi:hypothetical protein